MQVFGSSKVTVRRAVLRYDYWDGSGYKPNDPRVTFSGYNTHDSTFENIIALDSAPTPPGRSASRAGFVASGNDTSVSQITSSKNNRYRGLISINNTGNGIEVNGGTGDANTGISFKNILTWDNGQMGINIQGNDNGSTISFSTAGKNASSGFRLNPYPANPIINASMTNLLSVSNTLFSFVTSPDKLVTFTDNSALDNGLSPDLESLYTPKLDYIVSPDAVTDKERGATIINRYHNGTLTNAPLWPWPNEVLIRTHMCSSSDLATAGRTGEGWTPGWCNTSKSLTRYIWEYEGSATPPVIYAASSPPLHPTLTVSQ